MARSKGVCILLLRRFKSGCPILTNAFTASKWPFKAARCKAENPSSLGWSIKSGHLRQIAAQAKPFPFKAACCKALKPLLLGKEKFVSKIKNNAFWNSFHLVHVK